MKIFFILWAFCIGLMVPLQAIINSRLGKAVGGPTQSALISFAGGFLIFVLIGAFNYKNLPSLSTLSNTPPYLFTGGVIGSIFVLSAIMIVPKLGSTGMVALLVAGQLISSLAFDHFGLFGLSIKQINIYRILGVVLLFSGTALIIRN